MEKFEFGPIQTKWLESLEQHPERQLRGQLGKRKENLYGVCCLGELGLIGGICEFDPSGNLRTISENSVTGILSLVYEKVGLHDSAGIPVFIEGTKNDLVALTVLNDDKCTWPEIAAIVRANPTAYFSKSV